MREDKGNIFYTRFNYDKLFWLINIRTIILISLAVIFFFLNIFGIKINNTFSPKYLLFWQLISILINLLLFFDLKYLQKNKHLMMNEENFKYLGMIQIDFDILYTIVTIFLSGGIKSPLLFLFVYNIITSNFLIQDRNTLFYTLILLILLFVSEFRFTFKETFPYIEYRTLEKFENMILIFVIYFFLFYLSKYVSEKLNQKQEELNRLYQETYKLSITDRLTGLYDQTYFRVSAKDAIDIAKTNNNKIAIVMFDIDNFKEFNDTNGHLMGSRALVQIAQIMKQTFRKTDILGKYGGDEFILLLKDIDENYITFVLERFKSKIENFNFNPETSKVSHLTISIGVSFFPKDGDNLETLIDKSDKALYTAKNLGKNNLFVFEDSKK
uniref:GGDEF domain-containing protein n=1 Tax=candidate division WOR-3 bacterium TaxID=2052148 RepID=A0A7C3N730_UNCW3